ncbi:hypothetical protein NCCP691_11030 [Noviherbaspirillum aridicola]|uniref:Uncharacterized protein n=1 Tax=Noviherbaspirillum aridicola TaxID=2849687 RepID=A0ABQ4Q1U2_9BURK|nr:hypothetical protein NCCP691_11030 [Noviherbaspirillum aridicola]
MVRLWRDGIQVPRWQLAQLQPVAGELRIEENKDELLRRFLRVARLLGCTAPDLGRDMLPPLVDAAVIYIKGDRISISGFERGEMSQTYAQTWLVETVTA